MKFTTIVKGIFRPILKPLTIAPSLIGIKQLKDTAVSIGKSVKPLFVMPEVTASPEGQEESFDQTMARLNITGADIERRKYEFRRLLMVYLSIAVVLFVYAFYLAVWERVVFGTLATFVIMLLALAQAFRYHFWLFQIKRRKLGCTFHDWLDSNFIGENK